MSTIGRSASGIAPANPKRSSNIEAPKPTVTVRFAGGSPNASPVSTGGDWGRVSVGPMGRPTVIRLAAAAHAPSIAITACRSYEVMSNAAKASRS